MKIIKLDPSAINKVVGFRKCECLDENGRWKVFEPMNLMVNFWHNCDYLCRSIGRKTFRFNGQAAACMKMKKSMTPVGQMDRMIYYWDKL